MAEMVGSWPDDWEIVEVGEDENVDESESGGDSGFRALPPHLDAAVLVEHVENHIGPGNTDDWWLIAIQREANILGGETVGYGVVWPQNMYEKIDRSDGVESQSDAEELINNTVADLQDANALHELEYTY